MKELPNLLTRVFRTEYDSKDFKDEKFPAWLDILDHNLQEYRHSLAEEFEESKSHLKRLSHLGWFGSKSKTTRQNELYANWAYSLLNLNSMLDLSAPSLASFCYNHSLTKKTRFNETRLRVETILPEHTLMMLRN